MLNKFTLSTADLRVLKETGKKSGVGKRLINDLVMEQGVLVTVDRVAAAQDRTDNLRNEVSNNIVQMSNIVDDTEQNLAPSAMDALLLAKEGEETTKKIEK